MDCSLPGSSVHGILQARELEWGAIGHEFEQTLGDGEGQGSLASCSLRGSQRARHSLAAAQQNIHMQVFVCTYVFVSLEQICLEIARLYGEYL